MNESKIAPDKGPTATINQTVLKDPVISIDQPMTTDPMIGAALTLASRFPLLFLPQQLAYCAVNDELRIVKTFFVA
jgi:hypothetical protein